MTSERLRKLRTAFQNAFSLESPFGPLTAEDRQLLARLAEAIAVRQMATPAILFLASMKPLNAIGSQAMVFLRPFVVSLFKPGDYDRIVAIMDRREGVEALIEAIEAAQAKTR
jgi:hypothetical protein